MYNGLKSPKNYFHQFGRINSSGTNYKPKLFKKTLFVIFGQKLINPVSTPRQAKGIYLYDGKKSTKISEKLRYKEISQKTFWPKVKKTIFWQFFVGKLKKFKCQQFAKCQNEKIKVVEKASGIISA